MKLQYRIEVDEREMHQRSMPPDVQEGILLASVHTKFMQAIKEHNLVTDTQREVSILGPVKERTFTLYVNSAPRMDEVDRILKMLAQLPNLDPLVRAQLINIIDLI